jgi:cytoskeletal protein CcmA (bactofilin family)
MSDSRNFATDAAPARRFIDRKASTPTLVGVGTHFEGDLHCAGDLSVAGEMIGDSDIQGMFTLSETGKWHGTVRCSHALLAGKLDGALVVAGKLEIRTTARINGQITARQIAIAEGAIIEGDITVLSGEPIQRFVEKRHA